MTSELTWNGDELILRAKKAMQGSVEELALTVEARAKLLCPVDTGILRASIHYVMKDTTSFKKGEKIEAPIENNTAYVGTVTEYGPWVEYGTSRMGAQPFMRPSIDIAKGKSLQIILNNGKYHFKEYMK